MIRLPAKMIQDDNEGILIKAAAIIARGGIIGFRTDTFYGLGANPLDRLAVKRIRELKGREEEKPILVLLSDLSEADRFITHQSEVFNAVADRFWPGPLTLVSTARPELSTELTAGTGTIGVRLPDGEGVRALVRACGGALTATSANVSGQPPARNAEDVRRYFPLGIDLIVDGGEADATEASTVLNVSGSIPHVIREGAISREELADVL